MKKKIYTILICAFFVLGVTGCNNYEKKDDNDIHTFEGIIIECEQKSMIVQPNESEEELKSSDKFRIDYVDVFNSCNVGDKVKITYIGGINESYPAQIGTTNVEKIDKKQNYLKTIDNGKDDLAVKRIINVPKRGIGQATLDRVDAWAQENTVSFYAALRSAESIPGLGRAAAKINSFVSLIESLKSNLSGAAYTLTDLVNEILEATGYLKEIEESEDEETAQAAAQPGIVGIARFSQSILVGYREQLFPVKAGIVAAGTATKS